MRDDGCTKSALGSTRPLLQIHTSTSCPESSPRDLLQVSRWDDITVPLAVKHVACVFKCAHLCKEASTATCVSDTLKCGVVGPAQLGSSSRDCPALTIVDVNDDSPRLDCAGMCIDSTVSHCRLLSAFALYVVIEEEVYPSRHTPVTSPRTLRQTSRRNCSDHLQLSDDIFAVRGIA